MVVDVGNRPIPGDPEAWSQWSEKACLPSGPFMAAERQFDLLIEGDAVPGRAAYDLLYDLADRAVQWLQDNPSPDPDVGRRLEAQMMAYRAVADTIRSTIVAEDGDAMVAQLDDLLGVIERHSEAIDQWSALTHMQAFLNEAWEKGDANMTYRRRVPRQLAGWDGLCRIEGQVATPCRIIDISMAGLGLTLNHSSPSRLVGRRISVEISAVGDSVTIQLEGKVANATPMGGAAARVGVEFNGDWIEPEPPVKLLRDMTEQAGEKVRPSGSR
jgi:hypothetical protein